MSTRWAELDDKALLELHRGGDPEAFGEIFRRHRDRMWAVATRVVGQRELAADCVQDAFISAFRHAANYRGDAAVTTWLHRITVNACMDRLRRDRHVVRRAGDLAELDLPSDRDDHESTEAVLDVRAALAQLPESQRLALVLVDMHGLSVAETAATMGVAEGTVKSRCFRGREALAQILRPTATTEGDTPGEGTKPEPGSSENRAVSRPVDPQPVPYSAPVPVPHPVPDPDPQSDSPSDTQPAPGGPS